jgi:hypothetical protein
MMRVVKSVSRHRAFVDRHRAAGRITMLGTLIYILAIWTAISFGIGLTWTILCFARDGFLSAQQTRIRHGRGSASYRIGHRSGRA